MKLVTIDKPKEFFEEVARLIDLHYQVLPEGQCFSIKEQGFRAHYPTVYSLYLQTAADKRLSSRNVGGG